MDVRRPLLPLQDRQAHRDPIARGVRWAACFCVCLALSQAWAQAPARSPNAPTRAASEPVDRTPRWVELSASQRLALKPLSSSWASLPTSQKRKWIALSRNFGKLPKEEQLKLHERMGEWIGLSASERTLARLNFAATEQLSTDDKQAKWQAYQALSDAERDKLAKQASRQLPSGAAPAVRPATNLRMTTRPLRSNNVAMPRISAAPHQLDANTLLPRIDRDAVQHDGSSRP